VRKRIFYGMDLQGRDMEDQTMNQRRSFQGGFSHVFFVMILFVLCGMSAQIFANPKINMEDLMDMQHILLKFDPDADASVRQAILDNHNLQKIKSLLKGKIDFLRIPDGGVPSDLCRLIRAHSEVIFVTPNYKHKLTAVPDDPRYSAQYHLPLIDAPDAWDLVTGSKLISVGVLDTGLRYTHEDIGVGGVVGNNLWLNTTEDLDIDGTYSAGDLDGIDDDFNGYIDDVIGYDFSDNDSNPAHDAGDSGHGSHVAGIIGAQGNNATGVCGVNWDVSIAALKVFPNATTQVLVDAIDYAVDNNMDVINMSLGGPLYNAAEQAAINAAVAAGVVVVVSAGNADIQYPSYPAGYDNVITVASSDSADALSSFSNMGYNNATYNHVDITAPGSAIWSLGIGSDSDYMQMGGTSMACPLVAGCVALLLDYDSGLIGNVSGITSRVQNTAEDIDATNPGHEGLTGAGRINVNRMLRNLTKPSAKPVISRSFEKLHKSYKSPNATILLVDDDIGTGAAVHAMEALNNAGYIFDVQNIDVNGLPVLAEMVQYDAVVWIEGYFGDLSSAEVTLLTSYLNGGGSLFLSDHNLNSYGGAQSTFATNYLHVTSATDIAARTDRFVGVVGNAITNGMSIPLEGANEGDGFISNGWDFTDALTLDVLAEKILENEGGDTIGLSYAGAYRVVFISGLFCRVISDTGANGNNNSRHLIDKSLEFLGASGGGGGGGNRPPGLGVNLVDFEKDPSEWCFVATAAYGSVLAKEVETFRHFRDHTLNSHRPGASAVNTYYRQSLPLAQLISRRESLKALMRDFLDPLSGR